MSPTRPKTTPRAEGAAPGPRDGRTRLCVATRTETPEARLIRLAVAPDGAVVPDLAAKLPGRGVWVGAERALVEKAVKRGLIARSAGRAVTLPPDLAGQIEALLAARCLAALGLARRAGALAVGFDSVRGLAREGELAYIIEAADGSDDGRAKVVKLARALGRTAPIAGFFTADELGAALGRSRVVHAALADGPHARGFVGDAERLAGFRAIRPSHWDDGGGDGGRGAAAGDDVREKNGSH